MIAVAEEDEDEEEGGVVMEGEEVEEVEAFSPVEEEDLGIPLPQYRGQNAAPVTAAGTGGLTARGLDEATEKLKRIEIEDATKGQD